METYSQVIGGDLYKELFYESDKDHSASRLYVSRILRDLHSKGFRKKTVHIGLGTKHIYFIRRNVDTCVFHGYHLTAGDCPIQKEKENLNHEYRKVA